MTGHPCHRVASAGVVAAVLWLGLLGAAGCGGPSDPATRPVDAALGDVTQGDGAQGDAAHGGGAADDAASADGFGAADASALADSAATADTSETPGTADAAAADTLDLSADAGAPPTSFQLPATVTVVDLGQHSYAQGTTSLGPFTVQVPANALALALTVEGTPGHSYGLQALHAPDGATLVSPGWVDQQGNLGGQMCLSCALRVTTARTASASLLPVSPAPKIQPGAYTFRVLARRVVPAGAFQPAQISHPAGKLTVAAALKLAPTTAGPGGGSVGGLPKTGVLDLNLYFTGSSGLSAATAPKDATFLGWIATLKQLYAQVGLSIGPISYHDIDPGFQVIDASVSGSAGDFEEVAALTSASPWGVNIVFVREIAFSQGGATGVVLGMAGGAPGPVAVQGSGRSAVLIATSPPLGTGKAPAVGAIIAHELGHYLGLFHTTENSSGFAPAIHDPLPDTPPNDPSNLMYFDAATGGTTLTPGQGVVLRGNPWVRHGGQP